VTARPAGRPVRLIAAAAAVGVGLVILPPAAEAAPARCAAPATQLFRGLPWAQARLDPESVWPLSQGHVRVAVLDTGVSAAAPALAGAVEPGLDVRTGPGADTDCAGHGTFVAGLIAARPRPGTGFAGVAPAATVLPVRVTDDPGQVSPDALATGIVAAVDRGATVIALPLGAAANSPRLGNAVRYAGAHDALLLAAADGTGGTGGRSFPAAIPGVLAVAPMDQSGAPTAADGGLPAGGQPAPPALLGPGAMIVSIAPTGPGQLAANGGTGLAVAFAAGTAALVRAYRPALSADQVAARLLATADRPAGPVPDRLAGYGAVDPVAAVTAVLPAETTDPPALPRRADPTVHIGLSTPAGHTPARRAMVLAAALAAAAGAGALARAVVRAGRRRGWRPGDLPG
jgi:membrane-anchored mycosin MYCP